ncbi:hypothetical protein I547_6857 [Mycobacterium kansasii 824]|nr:hypothetical protein I547_6857 [Mycobacterium kansasii 824]
MSSSCSSRVMRVSCHAWRPSRYGELAATATCAPAMAWAAL